MSSFRQLGSQSGVSANSEKLEVARLNQLHIKLKGGRKWLKVTMGRSCLLT